MAKHNGRIVLVNGNMINVQFEGDVSQNEVGYILLGDKRLKAEVIKINGKIASMQVFEMTNQVAVGDEVEARVIEVNPKNWHLKLSIKQKLQQNTRDEYAQYLTEDSQRTTIGDLFGAVLEGTEDESEE